MRLRGIKTSLLRARFVHVSVTDTALIRSEEHLSLPLCLSSVLSILFIYSFHKPYYSDWVSDVFKWPQEGGNLSVNEHTFTTNKYLRCCAANTQIWTLWTEPSTHAHSQTTKATLCSFGLMRTFGTVGKLWETRNKSWAEETMRRLEHVTFCHDIISLFLDSAVLFCCLTVHSNSNCDIYKIRWNPTHKCHCDINVASRLIKSHATTLYLH